MVCDIQPFSVEAHPSIQRPRNHTFSVGLRLLGAVEAEGDGRFLPLGSPRQRAVLVALLVEADRTVPVGELVDRVWGTRPPHRARGTLQSYVSRLRRVLAPTGVDITSEAGGYRCRTPPDTVDLHRFRDLVALAGTQDDQPAVETYAAAFALWRGEPFHELDTPWLNQVRTSIIAERRTAELDHTDRRLRLGHHAHLLPDLAARVAAHPLDERLAGQLMLALYRSGRQADALRTYQNTRAALISELGLEPGHDLKDLHQRILAAHPGLATVAPTRNAVVTVHPRQLPPDVTRFVGRAEQLRALTGPGAAATVTIDGPPGVGKTAFAVHAAHLLADEYPDGQLYVDLRGYAAEPPLTTAAALDRLLRGAGVRPEHATDDIDERAATLRSVLADKRMLVVLDDARDAEQVRPLLPGTSGCRVLVTSRTTMTGLTGAQHVHLDRLGEQDSLRLLADLVGEQRLADAPDTAATLARLCCGLPLALRIAGGRLAARPGWPISTMVTLLANEDGRLDGFRHAGQSLRTAFSASYEALDASQDPVDRRAARVFRLLGTRTAPVLTADLVATLLAEPVASVLPALERLVDHNLLESTSPGHYRGHDLLHAYARELTTAPGLPAVLRPRRPPDATHRRATTAHG